MSRPTAIDGIYMAHETVMLNALREVLGKWKFDRTWGWDFPVIAMIAVRLGKRKLAVNSLLMNVAKNTYLPNGHNYQREGLSIYLSGNGGLLTAIAMMAAGWDNCQSIHALGFPQDGSWAVKWEGLSPMP